MADAEPAPTRHYLAMLLVSVIWGANFSVSKYALGSIPPLPFNAIRFVLASGLLYLVARVTEPPARLDRRTFRHLVGLGVLGNTVYQALFMTALSLSTATNGAFIMASLPVAVALLGALFRIDPPSPAVWLGVVLGTVGVGLVVTAGGLDFSSASLQGDLLMLLSVLCWALFTLGLRRVGQGVSPLQITAITALAGTPGLLLLGLPGLSRLEWSAIEPSVWAALGYAVLFSFVLAYVLWNWSLQVIGSVRTSLLNCATPVAALVVAWMALGERPTPLQGVGILLVIAGVLVSVLPTLSARRLLRWGVPPE